MPSVTRSASRARDRREAAEQLVLDATTRLLEQGHGYTGLGVQAIAAEAGIARSTFYVHFADKSDLLIRLTETATEELFTGVVAWASAPTTDLGTMQETLAEVVRQQRRHHAVLGALAEVAAYDPAVAAFWRTQIGRFVTVLRERLEADREAGRLAPGLDPGITAAFAAWGVERLVAQHVAESGDDDGDDERLACGLAAILAAVLAPRA